MAKPANPTLAAAIVAGNRALNPLFSELAVQVKAAVMANASPTTEAKLVIRPESHAAIMRDVDAALTTIFGARRGAKSLLELAVTKRAEAVAQKVVDAEAGKMLAVLRREAPDLVPILDPPDER